MALLAVGLGWGFFQVNARNAARIDRQWRAFAARRGLRFVPPEGPWFARTQPAVVGEVSGVAVRVEVQVEAGAERSIAFTRCVAALAVPVVGSVSVVPDTPLRSVGGWLGLQDVALGDPDFDAAWVVKADDPAEARAVLDASVRAALGRWGLGQPERASFTCAGAEARAVWREVELRVDLLDAALDAVVAAARSRTGGP
jgi:hypothetical protein